MCHAKWSRLQRFSILSLSSTIFILNHSVFILLFSASPFQFDRKLFHLAFSDSQKKWLLHSRVGWWCWKDSKTKCAVLFYMWKTKCHLELRTCEITFSVIQCVFKLFQVSSISIMKYLQIWNKLIIQAHNSGTWYSKYYMFLLVHIIQSKYSMLRFSKLISETHNQNIDEQNMSKH